MDFCSGDCNGDSCGFFSPIMHYGKHFKNWKIGIFLMLGIAIWAGHNMQRHFTLSVKGFVIRNTTRGVKGTLSQRVAFKNKIKTIFIDKS